ncbi:MAG: hypothetical protein JSV79_13465 [Armatimonadota bacterium]|nr:MAG: hypothetical protein JSV79_13465 [Armatimonadota bacterium]
MSHIQEPRPTLIDRWWVHLLVALWILAIVTIYFRLRISELLQITGLKP